MTQEHEGIFRALVAAQLALIEHADEEIGMHRAKAALLRCLREATKLASKLED